MGELANGTWAAKRVSVSLTSERQKSQLPLVAGLAGALIFRERLIVVSAHPARHGRGVREAQRSSEPTKIQGSVTAWQKTAS